MTLGGFPGGIYGGLGQLGASAKAAETGWTPAELPTLLAWYKADSLSSGPVALLPDSGPNGMHAVQNTEASQPVFLANQLNGKPAISFPYTTPVKFMTIDSHAAFDNLGAPMSWFVVCKSLQSSTGWFIHRASSFGFGRAGGMARVTTPGRKDYTVTLPAGYIRSDMYTAYGAELDAAFDVLYSWMGHDREVVTHTADMVTNANVPYLGARTGTSETVRSNMAELVVCRAITPEDKALLYQYFADKYALYMPSVDIELAASTNAAAPLDLPTYDGSGWVVHPDVVYVPGGWNGYTYWMCYEGYKDESDVYERVHIVASNDGAAWEVPAGVTNPVLDTANFTDADMMLEGSTMYLILRDLNGDKISLYSSTDGAVWSKIGDLWTGTDAYNSYSPSLVKTPDGYSIYFVDPSGGTNILKRRTATTISGPWSDAVAMTCLALDSTHIDVTLDDGVYYLVTMGVRIAVSDNGVDWYIKNSVILSKSVSGWDNVGLYRASIQRVGATMTMWYTGVGAEIWKIGKTTITGI